MEKLDRRQFLKISGFSAFGLALPGSAFAQEGQPETEFRYNDLNQFLCSIKPQQDLVRAIITEYSNAGVQLLPYLTPEIFDKNYPFWKAGEENYNVSWLNLAINHGEETHFSTMAYPDGPLYRGAMQRWSHWSDAETTEASSGWEFLADLPQGYQNDWKEILWAARFIEVRAKPLIGQFGSFEEASLQAIYQYCSRSNASNRIKNYRRLKPILLGE